MRALGAPTWLNRGMSIAPPPGLAFHRPLARVVGRSIHSHGDILPLHVVVEHPVRSGKKRYLQQRMSRASCRAIHAALSFDALQSLGQGTA